MDEKCKFLGITLTKSDQMSARVLSKVNWTNVRVRINDVWFYYRYGERIIESHAKNQMFDCCTG